MHCFIFKVTTILFYQGLFFYYIKIKKWRKSVFYVPDNFFFDLFCSFYSLKKYVSHYPPPLYLFS